MARSRYLVWVMGVVAFAWVPLETWAQGPAEPLLKSLPPGVGVKSSIEVAATQRQAIAQKLGGRIERLTNSVVTVHGSPIQVNVIACESVNDATAVYDAMAKIKSPPFCLRNEKLVIEFVGRNLDPALAIKTSYELGFAKKPNSVRYRVVASVAAIDQADAISCNTLFNQLLAHKAGNQDASGQISQLVKRFTFGKAISLRHPQWNADSTYQWERTTPLPERLGIPYGTVTAEVLVGNKGFHPGSMPPEAVHLAATSHWPVDDTDVKKLAGSITAGANTNEQKVVAILKWLAPGANIKYSGETGSRWGTKKVLEQKFGHCWDFSDCFVTLARASGVPCRQVAGWLYGTSGHVWAEFYREPNEALKDGVRGWQEVDPTGGAKLGCGIYHIPLFATDDGEMSIAYMDFPEITVVETK